MWCKLPNRACFSSSNTTGGYWEVPYPSLCGVIKLRLVWIPSWLSLSPCCWVWDSQAIVPLLIQTNKEYFRMLQLLSMCIICSVASDKWNTTMTFDFQCLWLINIPMLKLPVQYDCNGGGDWKTVWYYGQSSKTRSVPLW